MGIRNFTKAIAESGHSKNILDEIALREREIGAITGRRLSSSAESIEGQIAKIRLFAEREIQCRSWSGTSGMACPCPPVRSPAHRA